MIGLAVLRRLDFNGGQSAFVNSVFVHPKRYGFLSRDAAPAARDAPILDR